MVKQNKNNQIKDEWVIRLIDASTDVVNGYEKYLLDEIDYTDLAHLMLELKEVLPKGCTEDESENEKD